jgi:hypothetical protein
MFVGVTDGEILYEWYVDRMPAYIEREIQPISAMDLGIRIPTLVSLQNSIWNWFGIVTATGRS